jgi:large subunit ribosomal protein L28
MKRVKKVTGSVRTTTCFYCGKSTQVGRQVSHSKRRTHKTWHANLHQAHVLIDNVRRHVLACTRCLRSGVVKKVV